MVHDESTIAKAKRRVQYEATCVADYDSECKALEPQIKAIENELLAERSLQRKTELYAQLGAIRFALSDSRGSKRYALVEYWRAVEDLRRAIYSQQEAEQKTERVAEFDLQCKDLKIQLKAIEDELSALREQYSLEAELAEKQVTERDIQCKNLEAQLKITEKELLAEHDAQKRTEIEGRQETIKAELSGEREAQLDAFDAQYRALAAKLDVLRNMMDMDAELQNELEVQMEVISTQTSTFFEQKEQLQKKLSISDDLFVERRKMVVLEAEQEAKRAAARVSELELQTEPIEAKRKSLEAQLDTINTELRVHRKSQQAAERVAELDAQEKILETELEASEAQLEDIYAELSAEQTAQFAAERKAIDAEPDPRVSMMKSIAALENAIKKLD